MSGFLVNLARRGAGLPASLAAISATPVAVFPTDVPAPTAMGAEVSAYSNFVASNDERTTELPHKSPSVASPSAPSRQSGGANVSNVELSLIPETTPASRPLEISPAEIRPERRREPNGTSLPQETGAPLRSLPSAPTSNSAPVADLAPSEPETVVRRDIQPTGTITPVRANVVHFSRRPTFDSNPQQLLPSPQETEPDSFSPPQRWVTRDELKEDISAPVAVRPSAPESRERLAMPRAGEISRPAETMPAPIHVRIGRIEVRGASAPAAQAPRKVASPAPLGFASYLRLRTYRNWPR